MPVRLNLIFASSATVGNSQDTGLNIPVNRMVLDSEILKKRTEVPLIDVAVATICFSLLVSLALLIDANIQEATNDDEHNQMIALTLIIAFLLVSIFVCIYATHRMGACWTGPLQSSSGDTVHQVDGEIDFSPECSYILDLPPCYKSIIGGIEELPPPTYDSLVDKCKLENNCVVNVPGINHI